MPYNTVGSHLSKHTGTKGVWITFNLYTKQSTFHLVHILGVRIVKIQITEVWISDFLL